MHFSVTSDTGARVEGYLVPDSMRTTPSVRVANGADEIAVVEAAVAIPSLVNVGRHETGLCGFVVDEATAPGLAGFDALALSDAESGLLIYRRPRPADAPRKVLRLETHLLPLWRLDEAFDGAFQYVARGVERHGRETVSQMFQLLNTSSIYLSGRVLFRSVAPFAERGFDTVALLQDPYSELAERLLVLARANRSGLESLGMRDSLSFGAAAAFAAALPMDDPRELKRALRRMPEDVATVFANPLVRQLTTNHPDEMPAQGAVAAALDALSGFTLVGMRDDPEPFLHGFAELAGLPPSALARPPRFASVAGLANRLRDSSEVDGMLEKDRELHHYLTQALEAARSASPPPEASAPSTQ